MSNIYHTSVDNICILLLIYSRTSSFLKVTSTFFFFFFLNLCLVMSWAGAWSCCISIMNKPWGCTTSALYLRATDRRLYSAAFRTLFYISAQTPLFPIHCSPSFSDLIFPIVILKHNSGKWKYTHITQGTTNTYCLSPAASSFLTLVYLYCHCRSAMQTLDAQVRE